ncbi:sulfurtransferase TusA family protein [Roseococcus sp. SYP-B2431]|uniref:sulfurtransferase TusA family protein n=1 Tax=Roseococcus sp. SYP-B2431 TaxID=2496640 RepID=UPI00103D7CC7|nr:sulfurtransferase TusA family protein [Roseococcus sp. SYP-B2431]TCH96136.1 sulfurtransferase TusA family protein [Roseococcus sp. SYP-B2431]
MTVLQLVDVSTDTCPMTFVRARLRLDRMLAGEILEIRFKGDEPRQNLHRSLAEQGHAILLMEFEEDKTGRLLVRKGG